MATKDSVPLDQPIPLFLSVQTEEPEQPGIGKAWDRAAISFRILTTSILVVTAAAIVFAILVGNPIALLANVTASLVGTSASQDDTQSMPTIQSTADAQALPPTASEAPTGEEIAAAFKNAVQSETEIREPPAEALLKQFQAWAAEEDSQAQVRPEQSVQDAQAQAQVQDDQAQAVQNARAQVRPVQKHRHVKPAHNAQAEIRPEHNARAIVRPVQNARVQMRREQNAPVQVRPVQNTQAQVQPVQNAQPPWPLPSAGWLNLN
ncbi:hypothetical protein [Afipia sp. GAS231]|uniref:hypothetical protein n=1 Tax=Afipia sp. GAS231 TaxID=1882747 RepID=UPI00087B9952|nr:hypothetical protein [Afipia sp. GAS231]SDO78354.1 hypothetical protein SAMN05444050_4997 [Afipia sp. GAS231]